MMARNAKRIEQIPTSARIRYIKTVSEYYDGVTSRRWDARTVSSDSARAILEMLSEQKCLLWEALHRLRRMRKDLDAAALSQYVNFVVLYVFHRDNKYGRGSWYEYAKTLKKLGFPIDPDRPETLFYDKEQREHKP